MGFISGFVSGAAKATSDIALIQIQDKSEREKAEADALRRKALAEYEQEREDARLDKKMTFEGEQNRLDRESEERRANARAKTDGNSARAARLQESYMEGKADLRRYIRDNAVEGEEALVMLQEYENDWSGVFGEGGTGKPSSAASPVSSGAKRITTQEEYDALPPGAEYIDPDDGRRYRKPAAETKPSAPPEKKPEQNGDEQKDYTAEFTGDKVPDRKPGMTFGDVGKKVGGFIRNAAVGSDEYNADVALTNVRRSLNQDPNAPYLSPQMVRAALRSKKISENERDVLEKYLEGDN